MNSRQRENLLRDFAKALNRNCAENESNTPDFILALFLLRCLEAFNTASNSRGETIMTEIERVGK